MNIVKNKRLDSRIVAALLYVTFCGAYFFPFRGALASMFSSLASPPVILNNDIVSFFLGGLIPWGIYELVTSFVLKFSASRLGGKTDDMKYTLRWFFIPANVLLCLLKLLYLVFPLLHVYGDIFFDFICFALALTFFLVYASKKLVEKERVSAMLYQLGGASIIVLAFITLLNLLMGVLQ